MKLKFEIELTEKEIELAVRGHLLGLGFPAGTIGESRIIWHGVTAELSCKVVQG